MLSKDSLYIQTHTIPDDGKMYDFVIPKSWVELYLEGTGFIPSARDEDSGELHLFVQPLKDGFLLQGDCKVHVEAECVRCTEPVSTGATFQLTSIFKDASPPRSRSSRDTQGEADDPNYEFFSGNQLNLSNWVREHILLEMPTHPICRPSCQVKSTEILSEESPSHFGQKNTLDPRLAPLMNVARRFSNSEPKIEDSDKSS